MGGSSLAGERDNLDVVIQGHANNCSQDDIRWLNSLVKEKRNCNSKMQRVPPIFLEKEGDRKCFDPLLVSIGPYHHGKPKLKDMEMHKQTMACQYADNDPQKLQEFYSKVTDVAKGAREFYIDDEERTIAKFSDKDFTRMMYLDGCFILHFIYCYGESKFEDLKMKDNFAALVPRDLYLLENQLPFLVLRQLMKLKFDERLWLKCFNDFIGKILGPPLQGSKANQPQMITEFQDDQPHLLDVIRTQLVGPSPHTSRKESGGLSSYRSARELNAAGIHFRPSMNRKFKDVSFTSWFAAGFLKLPPITVDDSTKSMLLNMVAYETCQCGPDDMSVSSYICFIDSLIDHPEDVKELRSKGILINFLGSDQQVAELFNEIDDNLVPNLHAYAEVKDRIEKHYKNKINIWLAEWFHTRFSSPWTALAFIGAIVALILSFIQTYVAIHLPS